MMSRTFTLEEATAKLPRLREILMEMRKKKPRVDGLRQEIMAMTRRATGNGHLVSQHVRDRQKVAQELVERLNELGQATKEIGPDLSGFVLDLRGNPGGLLDQAVAVFRQPQLAIEYDQHIVRHMRLLKNRSSDRSV